MLDIKMGNVKKQRKFTVWFILFGYGVLTTSTTSQEHASQCTTCLSTYAWRTMMRSLNRITSKLSRWIQNKNTQLVSYSIRQTWRVFNLFHTLQCSAALLRLQLGQEHLKNSIGNFFEIYGTRSMSWCYRDSITLFSILHPTFIITSLSFAAASNNISRRQSSEFVISTLIIYLRSFRRRLARTALVGARMAAVFSMVWKYLRLTSDYAFASPGHTIVYPYSLLHLQIVYPSSPPSDDFFPLMQLLSFDVPTWSNHGLVSENCCLTRVKWVPLAATQ